MMAQQVKMIHGLGCAKSVLDGTEHIATFTNTEIPVAFS